MNIEKDVNLSRKRANLSLNKNLRLLLILLEHFLRTCILLQVNFDMCTIKCYWEAVCHLEVNSEIIPNNVSAIYAWLLYLIYVSITWYIN